MIWKGFMISQPEVSQIGASFISIAQCRGKGDELVDRT